MTLTERPCAFPPHPDSAELETVVVTESALSRFRGWLRHAPAERLPLPAVPVVWTAAEIMHQVGVSGVYPGAATVAAVLGGGWLGDRNARDPGRARLRGAEVAAATGAVGAWLTAATAWGPLAGPAPPDDPRLPRRVGRRLLVAPPSRGCARGQGAQGRGRRLARAESRLAPSRAAPAPPRLAPARVRRDAARRHDADRHPGHRETRQPGQRPRGRRAARRAGDDPGGPDRRRA